MVRFLQVYLLNLSKTFYLKSVIWTRKVNPRKTLLKKLLPFTKLKPILTTFKENSYNLSLTLNQAIIPCGTTPYYHLYYWNLYLILFITKKLYSNVFLFSLSTVITNSVAKYTFKVLPLKTSTTNMPRNLLYFI